MVENEGLGQDVPRRSQVHVTCSEFKDAFVDTRDGGARADPAGFSH